MRNRLVQRNAFLSLLPAAIHGSSELASGAGGGGWEFPLSRSTTYFLSSCYSGSVYSSWRTFGWKDLKEPSSSQSRLRQRG